MDRDELSYFVQHGSGTHEILREEAADVSNADLKDVMTYGFGIHHAGMNKEDREAVEALFAARHIAVLCTTATLAWGVNLPAVSLLRRRFCLPFCSEFNSFDTHTFYSTLLLLGVLKSTTLPKDVGDGSTQCA